MKDRYITAFLIALLVCSATISLREKEDAKLAPPTPTPAPPYTPTPAVAGREVTATPMPQNTAVATMTPVR